MLGSQIDTLWVMQPQVRVSGSWIWAAYLWL